MIDRRGFLVAASLSVAQIGSGVSLQPAINSAVERVADRVVSLRYLGGGGEMLGQAPVSGLLLGKGWVLTSDYGLSNDPAAILCSKANGAETRGQLIARDRNRRLALIRLKGNPYTQPMVSDRPARVGETVVALGRVYRPDQVNTAVGVISARGRFGGRAIQTDAAISPANYGGPLVGIDGELLGVLTPLSPTGQRGVNLYDSGIGFAVPTAEIAERLDRLASGETIEPGWLGISTAGKDPLRQPARLESIAEAGPAEEAGLKPGDTLLTLAGRAVPTVWSLRAIVGGLDAGQPVEGRVRTADGPERAFQITPRVRPSDPEEDKESAQKKPGGLN